MTHKTSITGFPRMGENRELKKALESYWAGKTRAADLLKAASRLKKTNWLLQRDKGIDLVSCNDFSLYDHVLDTAVMVGAVPPRFVGIKDKLKCYFAMARGTDTIPAMEMTKWFDTNYHYIVPELQADTAFRLDASKPLLEYKEAKMLGFEPKINLLGPLSFLGLAKTDGEISPYAQADALIGVYKDLLRELAEQGREVHVQMEEPIFAKAPTALQLELLAAAYREFSAGSPKLKIIVSTYFEHSKEAAAVLADVPVWGLGLDFVRGEKNLEALRYLNGKRLIAGVVDGRNVWAADLGKSLKLLEDISRTVDKEKIIVSTSCSLLHVPYSLASEPESDLKKRLAFCVEKTDEVALLGRLFHSDKRSDEDERLLEENRRLFGERDRAKAISRLGAEPRDRVPREREGTSAERAALQKKAFGLPPLPTTTIGSFPQTAELRKVRRDFKNGEIGREEYEASVREYLDSCTAFQERIGLDVLVHGEPERNDMVEYFGEQLEGFHFTANGWVQSYGSRCVKPPVIHGDVHRPGPMTVQWISYAQSRTKKPMKGMLTGPVTILNWSFVRQDIPRREVAEQLALALREEIADLQDAGIGIIQVDEAAFKEGYPLRREKIADYEVWAVESFKLAVSAAKKTTQIHTHMCDSDFRGIVKTLEAMDADVLTVETARSGNGLLRIFKDTGYKNDLGPGVYDIHSPRVPSVEEFEMQIKARLEVLPVARLWINPDCGLKTRSWNEVEPALRNMVQAADRVRKTAVLAAREEQP